MVGEYKSPFLQELKARGFIYQGTDLESLDDLTAKEKITLYIGYDATAASLHVGNLMTIMMMRIAQRHGHKPIVLMGGGTTKVADPSGKDKARPPLEEKQIQQNIKTIRGVFEKYLDFKGGKNAATMVDNNDWLSDIKYMDFLSEYGAMFSINRMLTFESVKQRLEREQPLSFLEFNYMVLQGYDFLELYKKHHCVLQMGGSDQWGNILNGVELIHKALGKKSYGLTCPLITTSSGAKMGKSSAGAVWLNGDSLAPFDFWQYWRNTEDADVIRFLKLYTDIPLEKIESRSTEDINALKILLADEVTKIAHPGIDIKNHIPKHKIDIKYLINGIPAYKLIVEAMFVSRGQSSISAREARSLIRSNSFKINGCVINNENEIIDIDHTDDKYLLLLERGKGKNYTRCYVEGMVLDKDITGRIPTKYGDIIIFNSDMEK